MSDEKEFHSSDQIIRRMQEMIEEEKKSNPKMNRNFQDTEEFEIGIKIGMSAMYEYLESTYDLKEKDASEDK